MTVERDAHGIQYLSVNQVMNGFTGKNVPVKTRTEQLIQVNAGIP